MTCIGCGATLSGQQSMYCSKKCGGAYRQRNNLAYAREANKRSYYKHHAKILERRAKYRDAHREELRAWMRAWKATHADQVRIIEERRRPRKKEWMKSEYNKRPTVRARTKQWRADNSERIQANNLAWKKKNIARVRQLINDGTHRRRARMRTQESERIDREIVFARARWRCQICGRRTPKRLLSTRALNAPTLDHIVAVSTGGGHVYRNLQCACYSCNCKKNTRAIGQPALF